VIIRKQLIELLFTLQRLHTTKQTCQINRFTIFVKGILSVQVDVLQATGDSLEIISTTSCLPFLSWIFKKADNKAEL
jgi:Na+-driven multidrug efflux pump